ncbi:hypothetical protein [Nocardioides sp. NPDC047086]|uniref:hypothetical protein n=1 Tax=Nocardioides sp. NPDC047086 TaxID=3154810 RepID=UPI0033C99F79
MLLTVTAVVLVLVLVLVMRWCIRRIRTLLHEATGPWRWVGIILLGSVVLAIGAYLAVGAISFLSFAIE